MLPRANKTLDFSSTLAIFLTAFLTQFLPQAQKHFSSRPNVATNASMKIKVWGYGLTNKYPSTWDGMKVNIKGFLLVANSYLRTLISASTLSTMIALGVQLIGRHFDNAWKTRCRSFSLLFPMTMKAIGMLFFHLSKTIKVYKRYCKKHGTNIYIHKQWSCHYTSFNGRGGSKERKGIPCFALFQRLHQTKLNCGLQMFPSFQTTMEFEFRVWMMCHLGSVDLDPEGHVEHNKKMNLGFPDPHFNTNWILGVFLPQLNNYLLCQVFDIKWKHKSVMHHKFIVQCLLPNVHPMMSHYLSWKKALPYKSHQVCLHSNRQLRSQGMVVFK